MKTTILRQRAQPNHNMVVGHDRIIQWYTPTIIKQRKYGRGELEQQTLPILQSNENNNLTSERTAQ